MKQKLKLLIVSSCILLGVVSCGSSHVETSSSSPDLPSSPSLIQKTVDIYSTNGTLPTLYAGLNMMKSQNESYLYFERDGTFVINELPENIKEVKTTSKYENIVFIKEKIAEIFAAYPNTVFNLFIDDLRVQFELEYFIENNIDRDNYTVTLLSDGTGTYTYFSDENYYTGPNAESNWKAFSKTFNTYVTKALNGEPLGLNPDKTGNPMDLHYGALYRSQQSNYKYWLQYPELMVSTSDYVNAELKKSNLVKKLPSDMFNELNMEQKSKFKSLVNIDSEYFDSLFNKSNKPNLIISGTSPDGSGDFTKYINKLVTDYGTKYDLFFKPHPAYLPGEGIINKALLDEMGIDILPGRLPMEALLWSYPELKIGGYNSSLYMSAGKEQVLFFLGVETGEGLVAPLNKLYALDNFPNAVLIKL